MHVMVVLGMHRAGTSAVARVCNLLGADVGRHSIPPRPDNPTGFWELEEIVATHDELLRSLALSWHSTHQFPKHWWEQPSIRIFEDRLVDIVQREFSGRTLVCLKDPRICRMIPLWSRVFQRLDCASSYLHVVRNPVEVAESLVARDAFEPPKCYLLWLRHVLEAEQYTHDRARAYIDYENLLQDWRLTMSTAWRRLGLGNLRIDDVAATEVERFIQSVNHHKERAQTQASQEPLPALINEAHAACLAATQRDNAEVKHAFAKVETALADMACLFEPIRLEKERAAVEGSKARLQALVEENETIRRKLQAVEAKAQGLENNHRAAQTRVEELRDEIETQAAKIDGLSAEVTARDNTINAIVSSTSWRLTSPLRGTVTAARNISAIASHVAYKSLRSIYRRLPVSHDRKARLKAILSPYISTSLLAPGQVTATGYQDWVSAYDTLNDEDKAAILEHIDRLPDKPLISVLMPVYNTGEVFLRSAIESVINQLYPNWELCIADDCSTEPHVAQVIQEYQAKDTRVRAVFRKENGNIAAASNSALTLVNGAFAALLDHDDELPAHALYMVAEAINNNFDADIVYSDEDKIDENGVRHNPYFKSSWNEDLFYTQNYINHLGVYRTSKIREVGGFRLGFEGSQDYDLVLRVLEKSSPERIIHIPHILYHWRVFSQSLSFSDRNLAACSAVARRAIKEHLERLAANAEVEPAPDIAHYQRIRWAVPNPQPLVSVIVPTRDQLRILEKCITGLLQWTDYPLLEVVIVDNNSVEPETLAYLERIAKDSRVSVVSYPGVFNYSAINNLGVAKSSGEIIGLVNNDIFVIHPDWLTELVSHALRSRVGAVGAMLYYGDDTIQHAGVVTGVGGIAGHSHRHFRRGSHGYWSRLKLTNNVSAVTGACLFTRRELFDRLGGLNDVDLSVAYNDVDYCLRLREAGYLVVWTPYAELYHMESVSRGPDTAADKIERFERERAYMRRRWRGRLLHDPYYNPNLTLDGEDFSLAFPPKTAMPWRSYLSNPEQDDLDVAEPTYKEEA